MRSTACLVVVLLAVVVVVAVDPAAPGKRRRCPRLTMKQLMTTGLLAAAAASAGADGLPTTSAAGRAPTANAMVQEKAVTGAYDSCGAKQQQCALFCNTRAVKFSCNPSSGKYNCACPYQAFGSCSAVRQRCVYDCGANGVQQVVCQQGMTSSSTSCICNGETGYTPGYAYSAADGSNKDSKRLLAAAAAAAGAAALAGGALASGAL
ncbi:unnamed protein product (mitochondrion) [Plasmodiophora brassicae]|uniref:EGF-like domain-containing protein n=1 Tax=Plasmodiophora brassicae TaxID=37360 RepID=A0A0G4INK4_PLABS|nr:hypothetical protein PBRA_005420 [Plasmodiophora brassicae]SPR00641.1 unnamed protein product [Plasmodiophora brassicae]